MAYDISLDLDGKSFVVLKCLCKCNQKFDQNGNPASGVMGGKISLLLEGTADDDLANWMCKYRDKKDGKISFLIDDKSFKKIEFKNAFLVKLHESFHGEGRQSMNRSDRLTEFYDIDEDFIYEEVLNYQQRSGLNYMVQCSISAEKISIDGVDHDNHW
jgi:hypothetical protein